MYLALKCYHCTDIDIFGVYIFLCIDFYVLHLYCIVFMQAPQYVSNQVPASQSILQDKHMSLSHTKPSLSVAGSVPHPEVD